LQRLHHPDAVAGNPGDQAVGRVLLAVGVGKCGMATLWKAPDSTPLFTLRTVNLFPAPGSNWKRSP
jgi:hypothetical protein